MLYLFNAAAPNSSQTSKKDIWLSADGHPVFVSHVSSDFKGITTIDGNDIPSNRTLAAKVTGDHAELHQLTSKGQLTKTGQDYCQLMGVERNYDSLVKFVSHVKRKSVDIEKFIELAKGVDLNHT